MKRADLIVTPSNAMAEMIKTMCPETAKINFLTLYHAFAKEALVEPLDEKFVRMLAAPGTPWARRWARAVVERMAVCG